MELRVKRAPHIDTEITVPGDKSISHRAAIIGALSNGVCRLDGFLVGDDCMRTVNALRTLGVRIDEAEAMQLSSMEKSECSVRRPATLIAATPLPPCG